MYIRHPLLFTTQRAYKYAFKSCGRGNRCCHCLPSSTHVELCASKGDNPRKPTLRWKVETLDFSDTCMVR